jgi:hypothetical protein
MKFSPAQPFSLEQPLSHCCLWSRSKAAPLFLLLYMLSLSLPRDCVVPHPAAAVVWRVLGNGEQLGSRGFRFQLGKKCIDFFLPLCSCVFLCISFSDQCQHTVNHVAVQISFVLFWSVRAAVDQLSFGRFRDWIWLGRQNDSCRLGQDCSNQF